MKKHLVFGLAVAVGTILSLLLNMLFFGLGWFPANQLPSAFACAALIGFVLSVARDKWERSGR